MKSISKKRVRNYLLYAVGEIILVVIGILIALQINNWNEGQKRQETEKQYLVSLNSDLQDDIILLNSVIPVYGEEISALDTIIKGSYKFENPEEVKLLYKLFRKAFGFPDYKAKDHTISTLLSSGQIEIITNENLRRSIQSYYDKTDLFYIKQESQNQVILTLWLDQNLFDVKAIESGNKEDISLIGTSRSDTGKFYNSLYLYRGSLGSSLRDLQTLQELATDIITKINLASSSND